MRSDDHEGAPESVGAEPVPGQGVPGTLGSSTAPDISRRAGEAAVDELVGTAGDAADARATAGAPDPHATEGPPDAPATATPAHDGSQPSLRAVLEAVLLVTDEPVPAVTLAQVAECPTDEVERTLAALADEYTSQGRGFELRTVAGGWRLYTRADCAPYVERFVLDGQQARLTQAALETLAVIAYRQPVTRARVSAVRGVNVDGVVRTLVARGLVTEAGPDPDSGATLYVTTGLLLEKLGLASLSALPALAPLLPEMDDLPEASTSG